MSYLIPAHLDFLREPVGRHSGYSERTIDARKDVLERLHRHLPYGLAYAATEQIQAWLGNPKWSRWTRFTYTGHVTGFYRWADLYGHLDGDPTAMIQRPKAPRGIPHPCTDEELAIALTSPEPLLTAVVLASLGGLRVSEIARAQREHITEETTFIPVGKGGEPGTVPTHPDLWVHIRDRPAGLLVTGPHGEVDGHWITTLARKTFAKLDIPSVTMHGFRHWFGTMIQQTYGDIRVTQECLRHASLSSTQIYTAVTDARRTQAVAGLQLPKGSAG